MEIRDYLRMLRRAWPAVLLTAALFVGLAAGYLALAPKRYDATTVLLVSPDRPTSIQELQEGNSFASYVVTTYAQIIDSSTVLGPVANELRPQRDIDDVVAMVTAEVRPETTLIDVTVSGRDPEEVTAIANGAAASASSVLPSLQLGAKGARLVKVEQIRRAVEPTEASSPNVKHVLAIGLVVGLLVGLGGALVVQTLDTRIRRVGDVRRLTDVPVLAVVPRLSRRQRLGLVARDDAASPGGEALRALRTNVRSIVLGGPASIVTASVSDDGDAAQLSANLAWTLAQTGRRVLLMDLDLRHSAMGDLFGIAPGPGASDLILGPAALDEVGHPLDQGRLVVVTSGSQTPRPSELVSSSELTALLREAERSFDYVVLHAPPVLQHTDAAEISAAAGRVLLSLPVGRTRDQELATAITNLANVRVVPMGLVLTRASGDTLDHRRRGHRRPARPEAPPTFEWSTARPTADHPVPAEPKTSAEQQ